jgi:hypothetical protein
MHGSDFVLNEKLNISHRNLCIEFNPILESLHGIVKDRTKTTRRLNCTIKTCPSDFLVGYYTAVAYYSINDNLKNGRC